MRRWSLAGALLLLAAGAVAAFFWPSAILEGEETGSRGLRVGPRKFAPPPATATPGSPPMLRGLVVDNKWRPVAGASVSVIDPKATDSLANHACPCDAEYGPYDGLMDELCDCRRADQQLAEMLSALVGQFPVIAGETSDAEGRFTIPAPELETVILFAEHATAGAGLSAAISPPHGDRLTIHLEPAVDIGGEVLDDFEQPVAEARVVALHLASGQMMETVADDQGNFAFLGVHDAEYYLLAEKQGFFPSIELRFEAESWLGIWLTSPRQISGLVREPNGRPAADVAVTLRGVDMSRFTASDGQGRFGYTEVEAGDYYLVAQTAELLAGKLITVEAGKNRQAVVLELGWVAGSKLVGVVRSATGEPLSGARVRLEGDETWGIDVAHSGADGRYEIRPLAPGEYDLVAEAPGHGRICGWIEIVGDQSTELDLTLPTGGLARGVVMTSHGEAVSDAYVTLESRSPVGQGESLVLHLEPDAEEAGVNRGPVEPMAVIDMELCYLLEAVTSDDGSFEIAGVTRGEYTVAVEHEGPSLFDAEYELPADDLEIVLPVAGTLTGTVVDADGNAVAKALLTLRPRDGLIVTYDANPAGAFEIPGLGAGLYELRAEPGENAGLGPQAFLVFEVEDPADIEPVVLALERGFTLSGTVEDEDGQEVQEAYVTLRGSRADADGSLFHATADGTFAFEQVRPGPYSLEVATEAGGFAALEIWVDYDDQDLSLVVEQAPIDDSAATVLDWVGSARQHGIGIAAGRAASEGLARSGNAEPDSELGDTGPLADATDEEREEGWDDMDLWGDDEAAGGF